MDGVADYLAFTFLALVEAEDVSLAGRRDAHRFHNILYLREGRKRVGESEAHGILQTRVYII